MSLPSRAPGGKLRTVRGIMERRMGRNRVFFPQEALDTWVVSGAVDLQDQDLLLKSENRKYRLAEGARIVREVTGEPDAAELVGKCKTLAFLRELGADILERSMIIDNNAYDIIPGFLGTPILTAEETQAQAEGVCGSTLSSDEELLAQFLAKNM